MLAVKRMERKDRTMAILSIADKMASAASSMNAQNYDTLIESRNSLVALCDKWQKEDESMIDVLDSIKIKFSEISA